MKSSPPSPFGVVCLCVCGERERERERERQKPGPHRAPTPMNQRWHEQDTEEDAADRIAEEWCVCVCVCVCVERERER